MPRCAVPATRRKMPFLSMRQRRSPSISTKYRLPIQSKATPKGLLILAFEARLPSPSSPPPATSVTVCAKADAVITRSLKTAQNIVRMIDSPGEEDTQSGAIVQLRRLLQLRPLLRLCHVWNIDAQSRGEVSLMLLLLDDDLPKVFRDGVFAQGLALPHALAVVADRFVFIVQIEAKHILGFFGDFHGLRRDRWHPTEIVDLFGNDQGVGEFFPGVDLKLFGDLHVFRALEHLRIDDVRDDRLIFARKIVVQ